MKHLVFVLSLLIGQCLFAQKYVTRSGTVSFEASVPSFEEVAATSTTATAILDTDTGEMAALVLVKGFRFKNALMEEHFNENYAESNKYPKASFKGKIVNWSSENASSNYRLEGDIEFHGVTKSIEGVAVDLVKKDGGFSMQGVFNLKPEDFNITIPKIVANKIANDVEINFQFILLNKG